MQGETPDRGMRPLLDALEENDKGVVRRAVEGLVALAAEEPEVARALAERLRTAPRWPVAYTLGQIARPSGPCMEVLVGGLGSDDQDVRWATQLLLTDLGKRHADVAARLERLLHDGSATQRRMAVYCLRDIGMAADGGTAAGGLPAALLQAMDDPEPLVRVAAVTSMAKASTVGPEALDALRRAAAGDADVRVRNAASFAVKRFSEDGTP